MTAIPELTPTEVGRFHTKVDRGGEGCWEWTGGGINSMGYGRFSIYRGRTHIRLLAHRVAYLIATGENPGELVVRHDCDNPRCVRSDHLSLGTQRDNIHDAIRRNRADFAGLAVGREMRAARLRDRLAAGEKTCAICGRTLLLTSFHRNRSTTDGRQTYCIECRRVVDHEYYMRRRAVS